MSFSELGHVEVQRSSFITTIPTAAGHKPSSHRRQVLLQSAATEVNRPDHSTGAGAAIAPGEVERRQRTHHLAPMSVVLRRARRLNRFLRRIQPPSSPPPSMPPSPVPILNPSLVTRSSRGHLCLRHHLCTGLSTFTHRQRLPAHGTAKNVSFTKTNFAHRGLPPSVGQNHQTPLR